MARRTQLNINIDPELMDQLKSGAIRSGKTITEFVSESIVQHLENQRSDAPNSQALELEQRLAVLEEKLAQYL